MEPKEFIAFLQPAATISEQRDKIPAGFTIAQAALESSWGRSLLSREALNYFGVKADSAWHNSTLDLPTREYIQGHWITVTAHWRKYSTLDQCFKDHANFFHTNQRYAFAFKHTSAVEFARSIALAGYATDPAYFTKLHSIITTYGLETQ